MVTSVDTLLNWARKSSVFPLQFGLACCVFEMIATAMSRFDISRFGMEAFRATPRQADLMIVAGTVTWKMAVPLRRLFDQMSEPKWVISMGVCATSGGPYYGKLFGGTRRESHCAGRRLRAGVPAPPGRTAVRDHATPRKGQALHVDPHTGGTGMTVAWRGKDLADAIEAFATGSVTGHNETDVWLAPSSLMESCRRPEGSARVQIRPAQFTHRSGLHRSFRGGLPPHFPAAKHEIHCQSQVWPRAQ